MLASTFDTILRGASVGLLSSVTVGPAAVLCIKRTLSRGRRAGFLSGLGVASADTLLAIFAFFFYSLLQTQIKQYEYLLAILGGILVIIIGVVIFLQKPKPKLHNEKPKKSSSWRDFFSMFGFTLANFVSVIPYILLFFALLGVSKYDGATDSASAFNSSCIIGGFLIGAALWWFLLTLFIGLFRRSFRPHHMQMLNRIAGIIIGLLGVITILVTVIKNAPNGTN